MSRLAKTNTVGNCLTECSEPFLRKESLDFVKSKGKTNQPKKTILVKTTGIRCFVLKKSN